MNIKELALYVIDNGGATVKVYSNDIRNFVNLRFESVNFDSGYMVGGICEVSERISEKYQIVDIGMSIIKWLEDNHEALKDGFLGLWLNDNKLYIEVSKNIEKLDDALELARKNNQLAIFDNKNKKVIDL